MWTFLIWFVLLHLTVVSAYGTVRKNDDGSLSSNSGPAFSFVNYLRPKRQYAYSVATNGGLSGDDAQILLDEHNRYRKMVGASNMQKVYWDPQLAASAQAYANMCTFAHSSNRANVGENIWAGRWYSGSIGYVATRWWYNEISNSYCGCGNGYKACCGHYSQLIWATTNRIGCGYAICPSIAYAGNMQYLLICQYSPSGNKISFYGGQMVSAAAYEPGTPCTDCPSGSTCDDGLCSYG